MPHDPEQPLVDFDLSYRFDDDRHRSNSTRHEMARDIAVMLTNQIDLNDLQAPEIEPYEQYQDRFAANAGWCGTMGVFHYHNRNAQLMAMATGMTQYAMGRRESLWVGLADYAVLCWLREEHVCRGESHYHLHMAPHYLAQLDAVIEWFRRAYTEVNPKFLFELLKG